MMGDPRAPRCPMSRHRKDPLRPLTADERIALTRLSRSPSAPAAQVERARALLAIADGASYTAAAHQVGRRHTETISAWVSRFNREGLAAVRPGHGGGARIRYGADAQQRILAEWARMPRREQDGTATWSLSLLQRALRQAPDGLPKVSTFTIWRTLHEAGLSWQKSRTWCETGVGMRHRKHAVVRVSDPDAAAKKADRAGLHAWRAAWAVSLVRGQSWPLSSRAASRRVVAAARPTRHPAARIRARWHKPDPHAVSSRHRPGAAATGHPLHACGAAPVAARAPERDPHRGACVGSRSGSRRDAGRLDGMAGGTDDALHGAARPVAATTSSGVGPSGRPQDARPGAVAVRAWRDAPLHACGRQLAHQGGVDRACAQAPRAGRTAPAQPRGDRDLV